VSLIEQFDDQCQEQNYNDKTSPFSLTFRKSYLLGVRKYFTGMVGYSQLYGSFFKVTKGHDSPKKKASQGSEEAAITEAICYMTSLQ